MNKNKLLIISLVIAYFVVLIGVKVIDMNSVSGYIVYSNFGSFKCKNLSCKNALNSKISNLSKDEKMLSIYYNGEYKGKFYGDYSEKWNMFTENGRLTVVPAGFIGISTSLKAQYTYLNSRELTDIEKQELDQILKNKKFTYTYNLSLNKAFDFDLNNDGIVDTIYCISNFNHLEHVSNQFTIIYTKINNKINIIKYKYSEQDYELPLYDISGIIKINNKNAVMVNEAYFDQVANSNVYLYKVKNNRLSKISSISNNVVGDKKVKEGYVFNFEDEFVKKMIYIGGLTGIIVGVSSLTYYYLKKKRKNINEI